MSLMISAAEMAVYLECEADNTFLTLIQAAVEDWFNAQTARTLHSTAYTRERYDGTGDAWLELDNYPVTAVTRLSLGTREGITVTCGNLDSTLASASITGGNLLISSTGGADPHSATIPIGSNNLDELCALVIAEGHGWTAEVVDEDNDLVLASELFDRLGGNADVNACEFRMAEAPTTARFDIDREGSIALRGSFFPSGTQNIIVDYTAGYTTSTIPGRLKLAILKMTKILFERVDQNMEGYKSFRAGDVSRVLTDTEVPPFVWELIAKMKRETA